MGAKISECKWEQLQDIYMLSIQRKISNYTVEKPDRRHTNQIINANNISNRSNQHPVPPDMMHCEESSITSDISANHDYHEKHHTNPNWRTPFKNVNVMKHKERLSIQIKGD